MTHFKRPLALSLLAASLAIPAAFAAVPTPATPSVPPVASTPMTAPSAPVAPTPPMADSMAQAPVANTPATPATPAVDTSMDATAKTDGSNWASLDANADGSISKEEAAVDANLSAKFAKYDKDKSGSLSQDEFGKYTAKTGKKPTKSQSKI